MPIISFDLEYPTNFEWAIRIAEDEYGKTLRRAAEGQLSAIGRQFVLDDAYVTGETFKSLEIGDVKNYGDRMAIEIAPKGDRAQVMSYIEFGRGTGRWGRSFHAALIQWLHDRKLVSAGMDEKEVSSIAFALMRTISANGIEPRFILEKAEKHYRPYIVRMFEAATRRIAKRISAAGDGKSDGIA